MTVEFLPTLIWFTDQMRTKLGLPQNTKKHHWRTLSNTALLMLLEAEVTELKSDLMNGFHKEAVLECADIANFAMMLADNLDQRGKNNGTL